MRLFVAIFLISFFALAYAASAAIVVTYNINGVAIDSLSGSIIQSGAATATIQETGESGTTTFTNGNYTISLGSSLLANQTTFHVGVTVTGTGKAGFNYLTVGSNLVTAQTAICTTQQWHFTGNAFDQSGNTISSGTVTMSVKGVSGTNSTSFSNGVWDIYMSPCLISGGLYTFQFGVSGGSNSALFSTLVIAK